MPDYSPELESRIRASRSGDKEAFGWIVSKYQGLVCSVTYSITGSVEQSEDLAQEAFLAAWQHLGELREIAKLPAWLCGIARNLAKSALRRRRRDPLHHAAPVEDIQAAPQQDIAESLSRAEREALLWRTLEAIPEEYREPLILFHREEQSVRAVAEALGITEDAAKQRLSRGRKMLKAEVERVVEDSLRLTRPGAVLTVAILAALPVVTAQTAAAGALAGGGTLGKGAAAGAGKAATGAALTAAGVGALGGLVGAVGGMTGGFFGMWRSIRNSPTLRTRRYMLKICAATYAFIWLFLGYEATCGVLLWKAPARTWPLCVGGWLLYIPALFALIVSANRGFRRVLEEDWGRRPAPDLPLEESSLSRRRLWLSLVWSLMASAAGSAGVVVWMCPMPWTRAVWPFVACLAVLSHYVFFEMYRRGLAMAHDEAAFAANPPTIPDVGEVMLGLKPASQPSAKELFYGDLGALFGMLYGPMAVVIVISFVRGHYGTGVFTFLVVTAALIGGMRLRTTRLQRRLAFFWVGIFMGIFSGVMYAWTLPYFAPSYPAVLRYAVPLIPWGLYWCIGFASLFAMPKQK
ncbi:MAG: sigma-70 family RNA polymerase sigma factor [Candidatus Sumerlaeota bacterium]|nr:sigma-70 family RNA polymerase sigma factor [Candidatus Sumerlaeota bacterium]